MWSDMESMELANDKDIESIENWASIGIPDIPAYTDGKVTAKTMDMRSLLVSNPGINPLLIMTDACGFTNFLGMLFPNFKLR
ncbi:hypothetical protein FRC10_001276 [Ceratobasidium sp. 414]|nr:hypothetical protein FRC10_001276 [Ceratobasidium sp. 414]